jgi:hypothetical protein
VLDHPKDSRKFYKVSKIPRKLKKLQGVPKSSRMFQKALESQKKI